MISEWLPALLAAWGVQLLGVLSPGPGVALILGVATARGRGAALSTCIGIGFAAVLMAFATVLGFAVFLAEATWAMTLVRYLGAAYLAWLAWQAFRKAALPSPPPTARQVSARRSAVEGFLMQLTNAKAMVFWVAVAAVSGIEAAPWPVVAVFLVGAFINSAGGHGVWAVALSSRPFRAAYATGRRWIDATLGVFFGFAALKLATSEA